MAESIWDAALKGAELGQVVGDRFTRRSATRKEAKLRESVDKDPKYANERDRERAYEEGVADLTRAALGRGIDLQSEFLGRRREARAREGSRVEGDKLLGPGAPPGAGPIAPPADGVDPAAAGGAAPIAPTAGPMAKPDYAGAYGSNADFAFAGGRQDLGRQAVQQGVDVGIARNAMRPNPITGAMELDPAAVAGGQVENMAAQGNLPGAQAAQQMKGTHLQKQGQTFFGMGLQELTQKNPNKDRVEATLNEAFKVQPQFGVDRVLYDPEAKTLTFMRGKDAVHVQPVGTPKDLETVTTMLTQYSQNPDDFINNKMQTLLADAAEQKKEAGAARGKIVDKLIDVTGELGKDPRRAAESVLSSVGKAAGGGSKGSGGFDVEKLELDGPSSFMINGELRTLTRIGEDNKDQLPAGVKYTPNMILVQNSDGSSTTLDKLGMEPQVSAKLVEVMSNLNKLNLEQSSSDYKTVAGLLTNLYRGFGGEANIVGGEGGGGSASAGGGGGGNNRADRNNNPGNIRDVGQFKDTPGYKGKDDGGFAIFDSPEAGAKAHQSQLKRYMSGDTTGKPLKTVTDIVKTWSPGNGEGNTEESTQNYIKSVADALGVDPNSELSEKDIPRLATAMSTFEGFTGGSAASKPSAPSAPSAGDITAAGAAPTAATPAPAAAEPAAPEPTKGPMDPKTHTANAARITAAAKEYKAAAGAWERWNDRMQDKYGMSANEQMTPAESTAQEKLRSRAEAAQTEMIAADRVLKAGVSGLNRKLDARASDVEAEDLVNEMSTPEPAAMSRAPTNRPGEYVGPTSSAGFFSKFLKSSSFK